MIPMEEIRKNVRKIAHWIDVELELPLFYEYMGQLESGNVYLEVGAGITGSSAIIAALSSGPNVEIHTVDDGSMWLKKGIDQDAYRVKLEGYFEQYGVLDRINLHVIVSKEMPWDNSINVLFIDGAHDYANVITDVVKWTPFVVPNGIAMFHDCLTHKQVEKAVNETMRNYDDWTELESGGSICVFQKK